MQIFVYISYVYKYICISITLGTTRLLLEGSPFEHTGNNSNEFMGIFLKAKARLWPCLFYMRHICMRAEQLRQLHIACPLPLNSTRI